MPDDEYQDAVEIVRQKGSIHSMDLIMVLKGSMIFARPILAMMEREGIVGPADATGRHYLLTTQGPTPRPATSSVPEHPPPTQPPQDSAYQRIGELEAQVARLKEAGRTIIAQRDAWEAKAEAAEARYQALLKNPPPPAEGNDRKFREIKRFVAMEFHPDQAQGEFDKILREALFKRIWGKIEDLEK